MATLVSDTHKLVLILKQGGFTNDQAESLKAAFAELDTSDLATKSDIQDLRLDMQANRVEMYKVTAAQTLIIIGAMIALAQVL